MHVRIAWEIYNHQQKAKADSKSSAAASSSPSTGKPPGLELLTKPPGPDYLGKRPAPPQDLLGRTPSLYGGSLGLGAPSPYDLLGRSPYSQPSRFYGAPTLGKLSLHYFIYIHDGISVLNQRNAVHLNEELSGLMLIGLAPLFPALQCKPNRTLLCSPVNSLC